METVSGCLWFNSLQTIALTLGGHGWDRTGLRHWRPLCFNYFFSVSFCNFLLLACGSASLTLDQLACVCCAGSSFPRAFCDGQAARSMFVPWAGEKEEGQLGGQPGARQMNEAAPFNL